MTAAAAAGSLAFVMSWGECVNDVLTSVSRSARMYRPAGWAVEKGRKVTPWMRLMAARCYSLPIT